MYKKTTVGRHRFLQLDLENILNKKNKNNLSSSFIYILALILIKLVLQPVVYKIPYSQIKSFGEEFQVVKRGREGFWEEYHVEKRVRGSNIICFITLRL